MVENTKIEWATHTFNPWEGCQKVGPGCDNCYAEARDVRFTGGTHWGPGAPRRRTSAANWNKARKWNREAEAAGTRPRVFCASLADVFDNSIDVGWRAGLWRLIAETPHLDWLLLTKRPGNIAKMLPDQFGLPAWGNGWPNVWLGCTIVNQEEADRDIPKLLAVPAALRFLSCEPLLGPVDLTKLIRVEGGRAFVDDVLTGFFAHSNGGHHDTRRVIDWVIVGGESGPNARPMHPDWARSLRDQCAAAGVAFHFKQWGEWAPTERSDEIDARITMPGQNINLWAWPDGKTKDSWKHGPVSVRIGKAKAGRMLDWRTHDGFPEVA